MTANPTVWVYVTMRGEGGSPTIIRYVAVGDDHAHAVATIVKNLRPADVLDVVSFDGDPRTWNTNVLATEREA